MPVAVPELLPVVETPPIIQLATVKPLPRPNIIKGIDIYKRPFIVVKMNVNGEKRMETFFQRYTGNCSHWQICGHATSRMFSSTGGMNESQANFLKDMVEKGQAVLREEVALGEEDEDALRLLDGDLELRDVLEVVHVEEDVHAGQEQLQLALDGRDLVLAARPDVREEDVVLGAPRERELGLGAPPPLTAGANVPVSVDPAAASSRPSSSSGSLSVPAPRAAADA